MLRECRRVLRPGGRIAYYAIHTAQGLSATDCERAEEIGPPEIESRATPRIELEQSGFAHVHEEDVTADYLAICRRTIAARERFADELRLEEGDEAFEEELEKRKRVARAIEDGLLLRSLSSGVKPTRRRRSRDPVVA